MKKNEPIETLLRRVFAMITYRDEVMAGLIGILLGPAQEKDYRQALVTLDEELDKHL